MKDQSVSLYFCNFPEAWKLEQMWSCFRKFGCVLDVFVPRKRARDWKSFGFVRFSSGRNVERLVSDLNGIWLGDYRNVERLVSDLNGIWLGDYRLRVNVARFLREANLLKGAVPSLLNKEASIVAGSLGVGRKSYAEVATGSVGGKRGIQGKETLGVRPVVELRAREEEKGWLNKCAVGEVRNANILKNIRQSLEAEGLTTCVLKYVGGLSVLLEFESREEMEGLIESGGERLAKWFMWIAPWSPEVSTMGRLV